MSRPGLARFKRLQMMTRNVQGGASKSSKYVQDPGGHPSPRWNENIALRYARHIATTCERCAGRAMRRFSHGDFFWREVHMTAFYNIGQAVARSDVAVTSGRKRRPKSSGGFTRI